MNITICGGGNLGHVCAGFLASQKEVEVSLLTTRPDQWNNTIEVIAPEGKTLHGQLAAVASQPEVVIPQADMVLICLPGFAIHDKLQSIAPWLRPHTLVGTVVSSTGFFFEAMKVLPRTQPLFGFQRVPFISRTIQYGHSAELKGYKDSLSVAVEQTDDKELVRSTLEILFKTPTKLLESHYEVSLSNSNPLLHTSRLYTMWKDWKPGMSYDNNPGFYSDWTLEASELYIAMDKEFQALLCALGVRKGAIPPVLEYYESMDAESLTRKIRSIPAFHGISSPMLINKFGMYEPDFKSRYFTEDFPYGLRFIIETADNKDFMVPIARNVYTWGMNCIKETL